MSVALWMGLYPLVPAAAHSPVPSLPQTRSDGQYWLLPGQSWLVWEVTAERLAARQTELWPEDEEEPGALLGLDWRVWDWAEVASFPKGTLLKARPLSTGDILIKDLDGGTWMRIEGPDGRLCFVRARGVDLKPVAGSGLLTEQPSAPRMSEPPERQDLFPPPLPRLIRLDRR